MSPSLESGQSQLVARSPAGAGRPRAEKEGPPPDTPEHLGPSFLGAPRTRGGGLKATAQSTTRAPWGQGVRGQGSRGRRGTWGQVPWGRQRQGGRAGLWGPDSGPSKAVPGRLLSQDEGLCGT